MLNAADTMALKAPCYLDYLPNCAVNCDDRGEGDVMKECDVVLMLGRELGPAMLCVLRRSSPCRLRASIYPL
jgi:hypothetical protein